MWDFFRNFFKLFCLKSGIRKSEDSRIVLESEEARRATIEEKLESQTVALVKSLQGIAAKSRIRQREQPLLLPYYLVLVVLEQDIEKLREGIDRSQLLELLRNKREPTDRDRVRIGDVTDLLSKLRLYQEEINPPLFYYDGNSRRIRMVDSRIFFVLANADRDSLLDDIPMPELDAYTEIVPGEAGPNAQSLSEQEND